MATIQYLPFYGGAKGQYLEVKRDNSGAVVSEKIVAEENISGENVIKNNNENLLARVLGANLQNLKTLSSSLLRLNKLGQRQGYLNKNDETKFKQQLAALGEAASNNVKLVEEIGENVTALYKKEQKLKRFEEGDGDDGDDVSEEGVTIENPDGSSENESSYYGGLIAEAKPYGLAVIGDHGIASSRPKATAIAQNGVAIAKPVGTAIAGVEPTALQIDFSLNQSRDYKGNKPQSNSSLKKN